MLFVFILVFIFIFGIFHIIDCFVAGQLFDGFFWSVIMIVAIALLVKAVIKFWRQDDNRSNNYTNNYKGSSNSSRNDEEFYFWFMHEQERDRRRKQQEQQQARENIHNFNDDCRKNWNGEKELYEEYGEEYDTIDDFFADHKDD